MENIKVKLESPLSDIVNEDELTNMFGEGGKEEVKEAMLSSCEKCGYESWKVNWRGRK